MSVVYRQGRRGVAALGVLLGWLAGCSDLAWDGLQSKKRGPEPGPIAAGSIDPALQDTIGSRTLRSGGEGIVVRGFGLVVGLGSNGSADCPAALRDYLIEYLTKEFLEVGGANRGEPPISVGKLIDSLDSAVVEVTAVIPPGAAKGTTFDVRVQAVRGTQPRSLEGGMLVPCELRIYEADVAGRGMFEGRVLARARGPVFTNPFAAAEDDKRQSGIRGLVMGGGVAVEERTIRLLLTEPSYPLARRIEARINERFGHSPAAAQALSKGEVWLRTPPAYRDRPLRFVQVAVHLYLYNEPAFIERRLQDIAGRLETIETNGESFSMIWEGIGPGVLPRIQPLYEHADPTVRYYAARAGLRVGDASAVPVLAETALRKASPLRLAAIRELGESEFPQAPARLLPLLEDEDAEVRIAAYEALVAHAHPSVRSRVFGNVLDPRQVNLKLDIVQCSGRPLLYVRRTGEPRIALLGGDVAVQTPMFYAHPDDRIIINASSAGEELHISYRLPLSTRRAEPMTCAANVSELIAALAELPRKYDADAQVGAGLHYSQVIAVLDRLCRDGTIPARLVLEHTSLDEILGPQPERPEADEPAGETSDRAGSGAAVAGSRT